MGYARHVGRVGGLAVALGIGVGLSATPWAASAEPGNGQGNGQNLSISKDGDIKVQKGTAEAMSSEGSRAKAQGWPTGAPQYSCNPVKARRLYRMIAGRHVQLQRGRLRVTVSVDAEYWRSRAVSLV